MKNLKGLIIIMLCLTTSISFAQTTISGVTLPAKQTMYGADLELNGGGLREKLWIDLYVGGLYVSTKSKDAKTIINADEPMSIHLEIVSGLISSEKMIEAVEEGFEKSTNGNTDKFKKEIATFISAFSEAIVKGDQFDITYIPNLGVVVAKNNNRITNIAGLEFKKALFGIWFGDKPADKNLKKGMLGL